MKWKEGDFAIGVSDNIVRIGITTRNPFQGVKGGNVILSPEFGFTHSGFWIKEKYYLQEELTVPTVLDMYLLLGDR